MNCGSHVKSVLGLLSYDLEHSEDLPKIKAITNYCNKLAKIDFKSEIEGSEEKNKSAADDYKVIMKMMKLLAKGIK